jgi:hypothetical protein
MSEKGLRRETRERFEIQWRLDGDSVEIKWRLSAGRVITSSPSRGREYMAGLFSEYAE